MYVQNEGRQENKVWC